MRRVKFSSKETHTLNREEKKKKKKRKIESQQSRRSRENSSNLITWLFLPSMPACLAHVNFSFSLLVFAHFTSLTILEYADTWAEDRVTTNTKTHMAHVSLWERREKRKDQLLIEWNEISFICCINKRLHEEKETKYLLPSLPPSLTHCDIATFSFSSSNTIAPQNSCTEQLHLHFAIV